MKHYTNAEVADARTANSDCVVMEIEVNGEAGVLIAVPMTETNRERNFLGVTGDMLDGASLTSPLPSDKEPDHA